jgi:hypothetical protein
VVVVRAPERGPQVVVTLLVGGHAAGQARADPARRYEDATEA